MQVCFLLEADFVDEKGVFRLYWYFGIHIITRNLHSSVIEPKREARFGKMNQSDLQAARVPIESQRVQ